MVTSPLTGTGEVVACMSIPVAQIVECWMKMFNIDVTAGFGGEQEVTLYECTRTKLRFFLPETVAGSPGLYEQLGKFDWYYMAHKWEHDAAILDMQGCRKVLEVGCGRGDFVKRVRDECRLDARGFDTNASAVRDGSSRGLPIFTGDVSDVTEKEVGSYDVVCAFQVLEHLVSPKEFLLSLLRVIRPSGKLIISVPDRESFPRYCRNDILNMPPHHMTQWSRETFRRLQDIFPLRVLRMRTEPLAPYHVDWYTQIQSDRVPRIWPLRSAAIRFGKSVVKPMLKKSPWLLRLHPRAHALRVL